MTRSKHRFSIVLQQCLCGWRPELGTSMWRQYDRHILEVIKTLNEAEKEDEAE